MDASPENPSSRLLSGLQANLTPGAQVVPGESGAWRLTIPPGPAGRYRLAQLDDYGSLPRRAFRWTPPFSFTLRARASANSIPGTWGFGLWNDPFGMGLLTGKELLRLPALPNTAWFFFASPPNYLSLRDDLPAQGGLCATFHSPTWPALLSILGVLGLPFLFVPPAVRVFRRLARRFVRQEATLLEHNPTEWHTYGLEWQTGSTRFLVDGKVVLQTPVCPRGRLGLVIWVDNQYAALPPTGRLGYGMLPYSEPAWIEIGDLAVEGK